MFTSKGARALAWSSALALLLAGTAQAQHSGSYRRVSLPKGTVLRAELNDRLSSTDNRPGDRFTGTIRDTGSGLPDGTQVLGRVTNVRQASSNRPGVVDVAFQSLRLPEGGRTYPIDGRLTSLDSDNVKRTSSGRLEARHSGSSRNKYQFLGYGAGAGAVIAALTGGSLLKGALLGAIAGYAYQQLNKDKASNGHYSEVNLKPGTEFGVLLNSGTTVNLAENPYDQNGDRYSSNSGYNDRSTSRDDYGYNDRSRTSSGYAYNDRSRSSNNSSSDYRQRTAGSFEQYRGDIRVLVNGQDVRFTDRGPYMSGGHLMVPLAPVAAAAGYRYSYEPRYGELTLFSDRSEVRMNLGDTVAMVNGQRVRIDAPAEQTNGVLSVPTRVLEEAGMRADWDANTRTLRLTTNEQQGFR